MNLTKQIAEKLLAELNLEHLNPQKKRKTLEKIEEHFSKVVLATLLSKIDDSQLNDFKAALQSKDPQKSVQEFAAQIPGLYQAIERRLQEEFDLLKTALK